MVCGVSKIVEEMATTKGTQIYSEHAASAVAHWVQTIVDLSVEVNSVNEAVLEGMASEKLLPMLLMRPDYKEISRGRLRDTRLVSAGPKV